jgi:fumarate reductase subunit D
MSTHAARRSPIRSRLTPSPSLTTKKRIEPLVWLAFSGGGVAAATFLPVLTFLFALAFPLGWIDPPSYDRIASILGHPITFLVLLGLFPVMLIHAAHRFRYTLYDGLQVKHQVVVGLLCYGTALALSLAALVWLGNAVYSA